MNGPRIDPERRPLPARNLDESISLIDALVGRCVREPEFARSVIADPLVALAAYDLTDGEMADFLALKRDVGTGAIRTWNGVREAVFAERGRPRP